MKCKDIERLIIDSSEEDLSSHKLVQIEEHVQSCAKCARLWEDLKKIRYCLKNMPIPKPPAEIVNQTRSICLAEIGKLHPTNQRVSFRGSSPIIPIYIWAASAALVILTMIFVLPLVREININQSLSFQNIMVLTLIIQNTVMLFFAPILIRKFQFKNHDYRHP